MRITPLFGPPSKSSVSVALVMAAVVLVTSTADVSAQTDRVPHLQLGAGILPGVGVQGGYIAPRALYTVESVLYVDGSPRFAGGEGTVQVAGGIGGAIRMLGIIRAIGSPGYVGRDFDVGFRIGPSLFFTVGESSRGENPFSLFLEPFLRATSNFDGSRIFFAELGIQRPFLRAGIWLDL